MFQVYSWCRIGGNLESDVEDDINLCALLLSSLLLLLHCLLFVLLPSVRDALRFSPVLCIQGGPKNGYPFYFCGHTIKVWWVEELHVYAPQISACNSDSRWYPFFWTTLYTVSQTSPPYILSNSAKSEPISIILVYRIPKKFHVKKL